ncbi:hypothetical protein [Bradyrhizobium sp. CCBAU 51627]|uniref:hypothetical protein n=1 Tax=Bradyrhizobium sp. CCBAU 51627 TaxID=1325088 RepID=UPI0023068BAC|nr:hypothetical protein [Bradyrhizobium sp. CCBAU 51627]
MLGQVQTDGVVLETMDALFTLLQVDRIARQISVVDAVAIWMEIETFLPDRSRSQNEGLEGRIESLSHPTKSSHSAFLIAIVGEAHREPTTHLEFCQLDRVAVELNVIHVDLRRPH